MFLGLSLQAICKESESYLKVLKVGAYSKVFKEYINPILFLKFRRWKKEDSQCYCKDILFRVDRLI